MKSILLFGLCAGALLSQSNLAPEPLAIIRDENGHLRRVFGVAGNFILGTPERKVLSVGFSGRLGWAKTSNELLALDSHGDVVRSFDAPPGPALFGFDPAGLTGVAYFPAVNTFWTEKASRTVELPDGEVVAVALTGDGRVLATIRRGEEAWVLEIDLEIGAVVKQEKLALAHDAKSVQVMGDGWLLLEQRDGSRLAVRISKGREEFFQMPVAGSPK